MMKAANPCKQSYDWVWITDFLLDRATDAAKHGGLHEGLHLLQAADAEVCVVSVVGEMHIACARHGCVPGRERLRAAIGLCVHAQVCWGCAADGRLPQHQAGGRLQLTFIYQPPFVAF